MTENTLASPVIIVGMGESGTRLLAQIALKLGVHMGKDLKFNLRDCVDTPQNVIEEMVHFLDIVPDSRVMEELTASIRPPSSINRYKTEDLSIFSQEELKAVEDAGCEVDPRMVSE